jgi:hypothetical protein
MQALGEALTMLTIFLPAWSGWTLAVLVVVAWLWVWALCRAAALGDAMIDSLRQDLVGQDVACGARDVEAEPRLRPQRAEAAMASATIGSGEDEVHGILDDEPLDPDELCGSIHGY